MKKNPPRFRQLLSHDIAIDLGTANTLVHLGGRGLVINEPSVVAINKKSKQIIAIGENARQMLGKTPKEIQAARPLVDGVVSDFEITEQMLRFYVDKIHRMYKVMWPRPRIIVGLPSGITEVEQRAVEEAARSAGARRIFLIEEPMAAAIGVGLPVLESRGNMIVDIGGGTTEVAIISMGKIVILKSLRIAGDELSEAVIQFLRDECSMQIGEQTAERIKTEIGAVYAHKRKKKIKVQGRNVVSGLPSEIELSSDDVRSALAKQLRPITEAIKNALEEAPPELVVDVMKKGIIIAGGGALISGVGHLIKREAHVQAFVADNALTAVVEGAARVLANIDAYDNTLLLKAKG